MQTKVLASVLDVEHILMLIKVLASVLDVEHILMQTKVLASVLDVEHILMLIKVLASVLAVEHILMLIKVLASVLAVEQRSEYTCRVNEILLKIAPTLQVKRFSNIALSSCSGGYIKSCHIGYKLYNLCNKLFCCYLGGGGGGEPGRHCSLLEACIRSDCKLWKISRPEFLTRSLSLFSLFKTWTYLSIHVS